MAVLGGIFLSGNTFHTLVDVLAEDDFYSPAHRLIYRAFLELYRKRVPIDLVTVSDEMNRQGTLDSAGGQVYLAEIASSVISAANARHYADIVKEKSVKRQLIDTGLHIVADSFEAGGTVEDLVDQAQQAIFKINQARATSTYKTSREIINEVFSILEQRAARQELVTGVPTGYSRLDEITAGLQPSDLIIIAARPAMGKTAFALNLAMNAARNEVPTAIFSLEMSMEQLMMRMLCIHGHVDMSRFRSGFLGDEEWIKLHHAADDLARWPLFIDDTPAISIMDLRARCRRLKMEHNLGFLIVDYLQLMRAGLRTDSREQEISEISRNLKALAKEMHMPVIALSQLNRKVEERSDRRPMLSDLRESGAIEQDADVIAFIYRDEVYNKESGRKGTAEIIIGKQRNGPTGKVDLAFLGYCTAFEDLAYIPEPSESGSFE